MIDEIGQHTENKSYIAVKKCRMLRSGVQYYLKEEVPESLIEELPPEAQNKKFYSVFRKPEAIIKHLSDFNYIAFVNEHPDVDVTPDNIKMLGIGRVGGNAALEVLPDNNVYVTNDLIFDDRNAYEDYKKGKVELSIGLDALWRKSENPDYDFEVYDFTGVNHLALVPRGRAGGSARVIDGVKYSEEGAKIMSLVEKISALSKDEKRLSAKVADAMKFVAEGKESPFKCEDELSTLGSCESYAALSGIIKDCLAGAKELVDAPEAAQKAVYDTIDTLHAQCLMQLDACGGKKEEKDEGEKEEKDEKPEEKPEEKEEKDEKPEEKEEKDEKPEEKDEKDACKDEKPEEKEEKDEKKAEEGCKDGEKKEEKDTTAQAAELKAAVMDSLKAELAEMVQKAVAEALGTDFDSDKNGKKGSQHDTAAVETYANTELVLDAWGRH